MNDEDDSRSDGRVGGQANRLPSQNVATKGKVAGRDRFEKADNLLFSRAMSQTRMAVVLTDPHAFDNPIIFANQAFRDLTGYENDEVIGRNCRFLQGPDTDRDRISEIARAVREEEVVVVEMLNYRKDGSTFWNALHVGPIYDEEGTLLYHFGSQWDVTDVHTARADKKNAQLMASELNHRLKNTFAVIGGLIRMVGRARGISTEARAMADRVETLGRAFSVDTDDLIEGRSDVGGMIHRVLAPYDGNDDRIRVDLPASSLRTSATNLQTLALVFHELAANSLEHGALSRVGGQLTIFLRRKDGDLIEIVWSETGSDGLQEPTRSGSGSAIIQTLLQGLGATIERDWRPQGLQATITVDLRPDHA